MPADIVRDVRSELRGTLPAAELFDLLGEFEYHVVLQVHELGLVGQKLRALYAARLPLYTAAADQRVPVSGTPEAALETLLEAIE